MTYEEYVGLFWNRSRALYRSSLSVAVGISYVLGTEPPRGFYEAITDSDEAAIAARSLDQANRKKVTDG